MFQETSAHSSGATSKLRTCVISALLAIAGAAGSIAHAQLAGTGAISGTVTDPTGAIVVNAKVNATNVDTNVSTERNTTRAGDYNIQPLIPGTYTVTVVAPGFEGYKQENVTVDALATVSVNVKLTVGQATETVTVTTAPPLLDTADATLGATMDNEMYSNLPIEMSSGGNPDQRRATDFAYLMPGVSNVYTTGNSTDATTGINGSPSSVQEMYIEGIDLPEGDGVGDNRFTWTAIGVDAVNQFQVQTAGVSTQYGGQGTQNYSIKSGGNAIHGSLYEFNRNTLFDAWAFTAKTPVLRPNGTNQIVKPREIQNEFGLVLSGPIIKNKLFLFGNYGQYREQKGATFSNMTIPTAAMLGMTQSGTALGYADFTGWALANPGKGCTTIASEGTGGVAATSSSPNGFGCDDIFDPATEPVNCTGNTGSLCSRTPFHAMLNGIDQNDVIPGSRLSQTAKYINQFWVPYEQLVNQSSYSGNLNYGTPTGLANWYSTGRIDYNQNARNQIALIVAFGRQASTGPNSVSGLGPPFNTSQAYHPVTNIDILKDTYTISSHLVNQISFGYGRYVSVSVTPDDAPQYNAASLGLLNAQPGQASNGFPSISGWGGTGTAASLDGYVWNSKANNTYTSTDSLQWEFGKHNFTFGAQMVLVEFNYVKALGGYGPMSYTFSGSQTAGFTNGNTLSTNTGNGTASYMIGAVSGESVVSNDIAVPGLGTRWRDPSFWGQDDFKVSKNLTLNLGLRWDIMPSITEAHNIFTFFNPTGHNTITGNLGTLAFTGSGSDTTLYCNCSSPSSIYYGDVGPRFGLAYSVNPKTVIRGSYGVSFARGNWTSGSQSGSPQTTGLTASGASPTNPTLDAPIIYWDKTQCTNGTNNSVNCGFNGSVTTPTPPGTATSLAEYGTGNSSATPGASGSSVSWFDHYKGDRTPEYINWTFGIQRQVTRDISLTVSYVGSQGHFISGGFDPLNRHNALSSNFAQLAGYSVSGSTATPCSGVGTSAGNCTAPLLTTKWSASNQALFTGYGFTPPNPYTGGVTLTTSQSTSAWFTAYPQYGVGDTTNFNGNENYHALQLSLRGRPSHGVDFMLNYTYSKSIDDLGGFRTTDQPRLDRSLSASDQPQNLSGSVVYSSPYGRGKAHLNNFVANELARDWNLSGIFSYHSGSPVSFTGSGCPGSPLGTCMPTIVPGVNPRTTSYASPPGGIVSQTGYTNSYSKVNHFDFGAFTVNDATNTPASITNSQQIAVGLGTAAYVPGTAPRTAADNVWGMGAYDVDMGLKRSFPIWEQVSLQFEADVVNVTNHTIWNAPSGAVGSGSTGGSSPTFSYGLITSQNLTWGPRDWQLAARLSW